MNEGTQLRMDDVSDEYRRFVEKFKPKKTTDDCYTPPMVYEAVAAWVEGTYSVDRARFVRPFQPGGDYERFDYAPDAVVVDKPPFSILSAIVRFYEARRVPFFLFAPTLTLFSCLRNAKATCAIPCGAQIIYDNGANVNTSFLTSLEPERRIVRSAPDLYTAVKAANEANLAAGREELTEHEYPPNVLQAARAYSWMKYVDFVLDRDECVFVRALDEQRQNGKGIYGGALLMNEARAAEARAAHYWPLSEREQKMIREMSRTAEEPGAEE